MSQVPLRRAQLIAPFGVGSMTVAKDGTSMICSGLDYWFIQPDDEDTRSFDSKEYYLEEWRLQSWLKVNHFRIPPDFRFPRYGVNIPNCLVTIPFFRFPRWHYCPFCGLMDEVSMYARGIIFCPECREKGKRRKMVQVPFVAMCDKGHLQDFPWREWVHETINPACSCKIRLKSTGGATLAAQVVECDCGLAKRNLSSITVSQPINKGGETFLSSNLDKSGIRFTCQGHKPWLGSVKEPCDQPLHGSLRSASNVYYAQIESSIYLPRGTNEIPEELISTLSVPPISTLISLLRDAQQGINAQTLRGIHNLLLADFSDQEITAALALLNEEENPPENNEPDSRDMSFRRQEFNILRKQQDNPALITRPTDVNDYGEIISKFFSKVVLVEKLRETRVLTGFNRIFPENGQDTNDMKHLLWQNPPGIKESWLPAYVVHGEGIYLELNENMINTWLNNNKSNIEHRIAPLIETFTNLQHERHLKERPLGPRFILLHTLAHLLMNRLVFECGYSSASLRERLYVSDLPEAPMSGILIYTAAGDSEGTLGGLVRVGSPGLLEPIILRALSSAQWCSADPVCMEMADLGGQGPDSCNLAACHNCCLVPETACEEFNRFLDRGLVVGKLSDPQLGYFNQ